MDNRKQADADKLGEHPAGNTQTPPAAIPPWFLRHLTEGQPLTAEMQAVVDDVINPLYEQLVLQEKDALLRAAGNAVVVAMVIELLEQPAVLKAAKRALDDPERARDAYLQLLQGHLKLAAQRSKSISLHLQLRRARHAPWQVPGDPFGIMTRCGRGI